MCILLVRFGKFIEDGNLFFVFVFCNLSSFFFNNYKYKCKIKRDKIFVCVKYENIENEKFLKFYLYNEFDFL